MTARRTRVHSDNPLRQGQNQEVIHETKDTNTTKYTIRVHNEEQRQPDRNNTTDHKETWNRVNILYHDGAETGPRSKQKRME